MRWIRSEVFRLVVAGFVAGSILVVGGMELVNQTAVENKFVPPALAAPVHESVEAAKTDALLYGE